MSNTEQDQLTSYNVSILAIAAFLFFAPWVWRYYYLNAAAWNAWLSGAAVAGISLVVFLHPRARVEAAHILGGLWILVAPWVLRFSTDAHALWTHVCVGMGIIGFAVAEAWLLHGGNRSGGPLAA
jgi:hypothetical protein